MCMTSRERQVLGLLLQGRTNKEIAEQLSISGYTVRDHVSSLLRKSRVKSRTQLIACHLWAPLN
ncbi:regulatory protein, LuxR [Pseudomonas sp. StFLB209]|nr:regulatory protein, LuxR [Pseudomonas sp. StFLB209]